MEVKREKSSQTASFEHKVSFGLVSDSKDSFSFEDAIYKVLMAHHQ